MLEGRNARIPTGDAGSISIFTEAVPGFSHAGRPFVTGSAGCSALAAPSGGGSRGPDTMTKAELPQGPSMGEGIRGGREMRRGGRRAPFDALPVSRYDKAADGRTRWTGTLRNCTVRKPRRL